ncbi:MAG: nucleotidyltransferase domain-containing protein [Bacillota bacterium]
MKLLLKEKEIEALRIFSEKIRQELGDHLIAIKIFGSKARGTDTPHSDLDVAIIVDEESLAYEDAVLDIAFDLNLDFDLYISPKIISCEMFNHPVWRLSPFLKNIQKEGVEYWTRA